MAAVVLGQHAPGLERHPGRAMDGERFPKHKLGLSEGALGITHGVRERNSHVAVPVRMDTWRLLPPLRGERP